MSKQEKKEEKKKVLTQENMIKLLDACYEKALKGIPHVSESVEYLATEYLQKHKTPEAAAKAMVKNQIIKCTTSGFVTGFGGFMTMPVAIPANLSSVLYIQIRMIACVAHLAGMDVKSDETQTLVYACLAGVSVNALFKQVGIKLGTKLTTSMIKKIPGKVLIKINQKVGFRLFTKFGTKGLVNLGKLVPGVGAVIGGGMDLVETKAIGSRSVKWFFKGDYEETQSPDSEKEPVIEVSDFTETEE